MTMVVLISLDIDGTQSIPEDRAIDAPSKILRDFLHDLRARHGAVIVHNTGRPYPWRHYGDADEHFLNPVIADADFIIHSAGTRIYQPGAGDVKAWESKVASKTSGQEVASLKQSLQDLGIALHAESLDSDVPYKISCLVEPAEQLARVEQVKQHLKNNFGDKYEIFYWNPWTIDITPKGANKKDALEFLRRHFGLAHLPVIGAGDSMNDYPVLSCPDYHAIVVGNATQDLKSQLTGKSDIYFAPAHMIGPMAVKDGIQKWFDRFRPAPKAAPDFTP